MAAFTEAGCRSAIGAGVRPVTPADAESRWYFAGGHGSGGAAAGPTRSRESGVRAAGPAGGLAGTRPKRAPLKPAAAPKASRGTQPGGPALRDCRGGGRTRMRQPRLAT